MQFDDRLGQVLLICVAVFIATPLAAQPKYTIIDLGTLGGDSSFGYGLNSSGHVTGHSPPKTVSNTHAFYYDGQMHDLGTLGSSGDARFGTLRDRAKHSYGTRSMECRALVSPIHTGLQLIAKARLSERLLPSLVGR